ncbi:basement membrane-specific heparan sulfate proteoglycan core protein-like isoform X4 [Littorina saxatilis]|uniref:basement membrane-specific heparan sulfate proteoglycan core protein-like isoform X4 n=1 Tax=Littorina saxatilis TaxID=31220 RepID=UPI0038B479D9
MAKLRTLALNLGDCKTFVIVASLLIGCVLAENTEKDFEFEDSDVVRIVKRAANEAPLISDDEDFLADEAGSTPDGDEGSGTIEPPDKKPTVPGYPVFYRVTLNFTDLVYNSGLGDRNSQDFQELSSRLAREIELLFRSVPGQQLVTILQFSTLNHLLSSSRGSVLVTLDLGSEGFDNPEVLRSVLEEAIASGLIGSYGVSKEGFTFKSLQDETSGEVCAPDQFQCERGMCIDGSRRCNTIPDCPDGADEKGCDKEVVCPSYVGREPTRLPRNGTNWANLLINNAFPCPGNVVGWEYYRLIPDGQAFVGVWRQVGDRDFLLVDRTALPPAPVGQTSVAAHTPINVQRGDFIGIYYPRNVPNNVIAQATLADDVVPASEMYQNYYVQFFDDMVRPGSNFDINRVDYEQTNATFAIRALMNYADGVEVPSVYTCGSNEFTCDDGYCIQANYKCDNQADCPDASDEKDCRTEVEPCLEGRFRCRGTGRCINRRLRCDGTSDCPDGSDEEYCTACRDDQFTCQSKQCIPRQARCDGQRNCEDGSDEFNCPPSTCGPDEYRCIDGSCISVLLLCDSRADCPGGDDEFRCPARQCRPNQFRCNDGSCILANKECDSTPDCPDFSDEDPERCVPFSGLCASSEYQCEDGSCIQADLQCDGFVDCIDGSDEWGCEDYPFPEICNEGLFRCDDGQCVNPVGRCDGINDCGDGSDERSCPCRSDEFTCRSGQCIPQVQRCDRVRNCPDDSDEQNCPVQPRCTDGDFECGDGTCLDGRLRCDGVPDCRDLTDEANCPRRTCSAIEFTCEDGQCVDVRARCNGATECVDGSDEQGCPCQDGEFQCRDRQCIPDARKCDRRRDCRDGSDEEECEGVCNRREFRCNDGTCVDGRVKCDRFVNCPDGSDEFDCACNAAEFRCRNGQCVAGQRYCDGRQDCIDGSDEDACQPDCSPDQFQCQSGECVDRRRKCDGRRDCRDGSEEQDCPCTQDEFTCVSDGRCVPAARLCNGVPECDDGSDELDCGCKADEFTCTSDDRCIPSNRVCDRRMDCRDGSDEANCPCQSDQFTCRSDGRCIPSNRKCDRRRDCTDGSDELDCECGANEFTCDDSQCVSSVRRCDRRRDCADGSDELNCPCRADQFTCETSRQCIPTSRKCDRRTDCLDGSDERDCGPRCEPGEHECDNRCIPAPYVCNGRAECSDGSDEDNCPTCDEATEFQCGDGRCIPAGYRCNGRAECADRTDELDCPPRIVVVINPTAVRVRRGQTAVFFCEAMGGATAPVTWSRSDNQRLPTGYTESRGRLTLTGVSEEDSGDYVCTVVDPTGTFRTTARLDVDFIGPVTTPPDPNGRCRADEATCSNGQCIPRDYVCDTEQDCSDGSDELTCDRPLPCEPNEFQCNNGRCAMKIWRCDGDNDCGDGSDESNCPTQDPGEKCRMDQFMCQRGDQCVPASYQCDGEVDCQDRSDEIGCSVPTIIKPPRPEIEVEINGTFTIYCEAVGVPTPLITWRLNWGNIPTGSRVTVTSVDGRGTLTIRFARPEDAGAYTCEALNNRGSIFATPDALIIVRRQVGVCQPPRFNFEASRNDECVRCFCFGHTETCYSSNMQISQITMGSRLELVQRATLLPVEEGFIQYISSSSEFAVQDFNRAFPSGTYYWSLPAQYLGNRLTSYGGDLSYTVLYDVDNFDLPTSDPDVIIEGNDISVFYRRRDSVPARQRTMVRVPLVEDDWEKSEGPIRGDLPVSGLATRQDLMTVLQNVTRILVRATYDQRQSSIRIGNILLSTAVTQNTGLGRAVYVEDCSCPTGYTGLSCETCAPGYSRIQRGRYLGECVPCNCNGHSSQCDPDTGFCLNCLHNTEGPYCDRCSEGFIGDARRGTPNDCEPCPCPLTIPTNQFSRTCVRDRDGDITCTNCPTGYTGRRCDSCARGYRGNPSVPGDRCTPINVTDICDPRGSLSTVPPVGSDRCMCKQNAEGQFCDRCKSDTFYLSNDYPYGCIPCFCMGVTQMCQSTSSHRAEVVASFSSDRGDVSLSNMMQTREITQGFSVNRANRELVYRRFDNLPQESYYWKLPARFLGDKVTAYGGNLRFTLRYRPGDDSSPITLGEPIVEIGGNDIILVYRADRQVPPNSPEPFSIPFYETDWLRMDGEPANREHLLMALADLDFILIRATYTQTTAEAGLSDLSMDIAESRITGKDRAFAVEQCNCPPGYRGLSCEDCDTGFTRSGGGLYLGLCEPCQCNGHSTECDPETGVCRNCRHNTGGENCERCIAGFYGDATRGSVNDCQKCPCPLTEPPNQFSPTCSLATDGQVTCDSCPRGHTGRRCERCEAGYQGNPLQPGDFCKQVEDRCDCDPRGTVPNTQCDPQSQQCQCKAYVQGRRCSACEDGYFHLDTENQQGCLACFCMGITNECSSSSYSRNIIRPQFNPDGSHSFSLTSRRLSQSITDGFSMDATRNEISFNNFEGIQRERESLFLQLPPKFRGDKVSSYGGYLRFTLSYTTAFDAGRKYMDVDLEIIGNDQRMYLLFDPTPESGDTRDFEILLRESSFRTLDGSEPTREQFLTILADIDAILIRATYNTIMSSLTIRNLEMEIAVPQATGERRTPEVESCRCPEGYTGLSCQSCAAGYLRVPDSGTALGRCTRCNCNNHATSCDPSSGRCMNCQDNTVGDRCEQCAPGYYGDPTAGTNNDCRPCPCPLTTPGNRFSPTCFLDQDRQVTCDQCPPGYSGRDCGNCAPGYAGNPREPGGRCSAEEVDRRPTVTVSPITLQEPVGSRVRFQCQVGGRPPFNVVWSRLDGRPLSDASSTGVGPGYELLINRVEYSDAGRYVCTATNTYGTTRGIAELIVERPSQPLRVMIEEPRQITTSVGSSVRLVCVAISYSSEANYVLSWSKDGGRLPARAIDQNGVLVIPELQEGDAGQYTCTGSDPYSIDRATAVIRIEDIDRSPTARIEPRYLQVNEGQSIEFRCIAEGTPAPTIRWTRGPDGPLPDYATVQDGVFRIANIRKSDEAEYYCTATNIAGTSSTRTIVYVTRTVEPPGPLTIIVRRAQITATIGSDVQLECYASDENNVILVWSRQGGLPPGSTQDGGILNIPNIQQSYQGNYICSGTGPTGSIGRATAIVTVIPRDDREPPTARVEPDMQTVSEGTTGTLRCVVTGKPRPTITWSRARGELTSNHVPQGEMLRITRATMEDRGIYICTVSNIAGRAQASGIVDIERRQSPVIELFPQEPQTIQPGGSALFQCRVTGGIPAPTVTWSRVGGKQFTATTKLMTESGVIMFERVTGEEQGSYICTATNAAGTITLTATLIIQGPPSVVVTPGTDITVIEGERVNIECVGEGDPTPNVFWRSDTRRRSDILPEAYDPAPGTAGLIFDPVATSDAGRYTCVARNDRGITEQNVDLSVNPDDNTGVAPLVDIVGPDRLTLVDGQSVELSCTARGLRSPLIRWRRPNNQPLPPGHSVQGGTLYIPRISSDFQGEYQCVVTAERGNYTSSVILIVSVTPRLTISPGQTTVRAGDSVTLRCEPTGQGPFQIEWQKVGGQLPRNAREFDGVLEIRQVTGADAGQYRCIATNTAGTSEGYSTLNVAVPPAVSVTPKDENRQIGNTVEFRCMTTGDRGVVRWDKDGADLPAQHQIRNGILTLYNIQKEDEGRYICTVTSDSGMARDYAYLRVSTAPDIGSTIGQSVQNVDAGDRVEFECIVTGTPRPTVQWNKLEGPLPSNAIIGEGILIIPEAKPDDAGTYRCTATNVAGSVQSQVQLFVQSIPVISQQQDLQTAALGSPTTLSCDTLGAPEPVITWTKKDGDLPTEHRIENNGALYIPRVREEDAGTYECAASNQRGVARLPIVLVIGAFVPYFPQNPNSYMSFQPLRDVYLDLDILLSFRPETTDGMLLYNGQYRNDRQTGADDRGDFVCFGMRDSIPEFRFDVGSGPAIIRGQTPLEMNRWHTVHLKRQRKNGTLLVNDEPAYNGEAPGRFVGMDIVEPMYLGGVPNYAEVPRSAGFNRGFIGSVSQVHLKGQPLNLGAAAIDVYGVEQYDACRESPCYSGGRCLIANTYEGFTCQCPRGFAGQRCETQGYRCYPGACGAGRCYDFPDGSGFQCICPIGYSGEGCAIGLRVVDPAFNKTSFISYPTIKGGLISVTLKLMFKPRSRDDGIILYNAQKQEGAGDFVAIIMKEGFVEFRFDTGSGPAVLRSRNQIPINDWARVTVDRNGRDGMLVVNNEDPVNEQVDNVRDLYSRRDRGDVFNRGTTSGNTVGLNLKRPLFLGGVDPAEALSPNVGTADGFVGCIAELSVETEAIDLMGDAIESVNIADCGDRSLCERDPCKNGGICQDLSTTDYRCQCPEDYTGRNCETEIDECLTLQPCENGGTCDVVGGIYRCSCPIGFMGRNCDTRITIKKSFEVSGNGYVEFERALLPHRRRQVGESILFTITTVEPDGLVFWQGQQADGQSGNDYLAVELRNGLVHFLYELGSGPANLTSSVRVDDGYPHIIEATRQGRDGKLSVDGGEEVEGSSLGPLQVLNVQGNIFFGGVPDLQRYTDGKFTSNFNGCVKDIQIQNGVAVDVGSTAIGGANVRPCLDAK